MAVLKRMLPTAVAIAVGIFVLAAVFTSYPILDALGAYFIDMAVIIAAFALFLGMLNVLRVHGRKIRERQPGSLYSVVLVAAMLIVLVVGLPPLPDQPSGPSQPAVQWIFENVQAPIQASLSALIVFFIVTAAYRLFQRRSLESALMLVVTLLVLAGQVTVGLLPVLPDLKEWILDVPAMAGVRGILLGVALGALLTGIRLLLGVERPYSD
jgi:type IV secretory pathway VirB2 component (pilin)